MATIHHVDRLQRASGTGPGRSKLAETVLPPQNTEALSKTRSPVREDEAGRCRICADPSEVRGDAKVSLEVSNPIVRREL